MKTQKFIFPFTAICSLVVMISAAFGGSNNTYYGTDALNNNTDPPVTGGGNSAFGYTALFSTTSGSSNTAVGFNALYSNTTGDFNTAEGYPSLFNNIGGSDNTANGYNALESNTNGSDNTAIGTDALVKNASGSENTGIGFAALDDNTTGTNNTALGYEAGFLLTTGSGNIEIGNVGVSTDNSITRIGHLQTNVYIAGIYGTTSSGGVEVYVDSSGQLGTVTSSKRFKQNIQGMGDASDVLLSLHPVKFQYKQDLDPRGTPQFGLVAEEVDKIDPDLVVRDGQNNPYSVRYEAVNAMLLNEFLKQHKTVEQQETQIAALKGQLNELSEAVHALQAKK